jgi:hypothetical protein
MAMTDSMTQGLKGGHTACISCILSALHLVPALTNKVTPEERAFTRLGLDNAENVGLDFYRTGISGYSVQLDHVFSTV